MKPFIALFSYGGLHHRTLDAIAAEERALQAKGIKYELQHVHDDALISRSRSWAMSRFLRSDCDVMVMVDHDIAWHKLREPGRTSAWPGALLALADLAHLKKAAVGGFYATRAKNAGTSSRAQSDLLRLEPGKDELFDAAYLPGGFVAYPMAAVQKVLATGTECARFLKEVGALGTWRTTEKADAYRVPMTTLTMAEAANLALHECVYFDGTPFYDFFRPITVPSTLSPGRFEYLSEDWAFSHRLAAAQVKQVLWNLPVLLHYGEYGFNLLEAGQGVAPAGQVRR